MWARSTSHASRSVTAGDASGGGRGGAGAGPGPRHDPVPQREGGGDDLLGQAVHRDDGHDGEGVDRVGRRGQPVDAEPGPEPRVGGVDPREQQHQQRHHDDDQPRAVGELADGHDDRGEPGEHHPRGVDRGVAPPARAALAAPVTDHAQLAEEEADEHPDGEDRDEHVHVTARDEQQHRGQPAEHQDPPPVHEPVAPQPEQVGQVAVAGEPCREDRQAPERRVRRQREQHDGADLHHQVERAVAHGALGDQREQRAPVDGAGVEALDEHGEPDEQEPQDDAQRGLGAPGPDRARGAERGGRVGDGLDPGQRGAAVGERGEQQEDPDRADGPRRGGGRQRGQRRTPDQADHHHGADHDDEHDRGADEQPRARHQAAQVHQRHHDDDRQAQLRGPRQQGGGGRGERRDPGGHRDRDVEHVVDDQRRRRHERGTGPEVAPGHGVGAAAVGIGGDDLAVTGHEHEQQRHDPGRDRQRRAEPRASRGREDDDDRLRAVGDRGEGVETQRRGAGHRPEAVPPVVVRRLPGIRVGGGVGLAVPGVRRRDRRAHRCRPRRLRRAVRTDREASPT